MDLRYFLKGLLLPPFTQIILLFIAWYLRHRKPRISSAIFFTALLSLWILGTPVTATYLAQTLEHHAAILPDAINTIRADALVILSGGQNESAAEFGQSVTSEGAYTRLRYGAFLHRRTGLPILLSGGSVRGDEHRSLAETMAFDLSEGFGINATWLEKKSRTTAENARLSFSLLQKEQKTKVVLVTSAKHMLRAHLSFEQAGFEVLPAPTNFTEQRPLHINSFMPNAHSLRLSSDAIHEWLGYWVYKLLY